MLIFPGNIKKLVALFLTSAAKLTDFDNDKRSKSVLKMNFRRNKYNGYDTIQAAIGMGDVGAPRVDACVRPHPRAPERAPESQRQI